MGVSKYLKEQNPAIQIIGLQPEDGAQIAGIRRWPTEYLPTIFDASRVDRIIDIPQLDAERSMRALARHEGISAGVSSGGAVWAALKIAEESPDAVIACIICDRGDRYLSTGLFSVVDADSSAC
jgi:cysteine synthase B